MTDHEMSQLRRNLLEQFQQMMTEELPPVPDEYGAQFPTFDWSNKY